MTNQSRAAFCLMTGVLILLSGCFFKSTDELYAVPQASEEYVNLKETIEAVKGTADYAAPTTGSNTQTVQLVDLDGDGTQEAVTFFRDNNTEKPLKIYIFSQTTKDEYKDVAVIEGDGTAIESISYNNLNGMSSKEIVVSWAMSTSVHILVAYSYDAGEVTELMRSGYSYYVPTDIDRDGADELLLIQMNESEDSNSVEYYDYKDGAMVLCSSAPLSKEIEDVRTFRAGYVKDNVPALYITSDYVNNGLITDILCLNNGKLQNITLDPDTGLSSGTLRLNSTVEPADIDGDGILELPQPHSIGIYGENINSENFWIIKWWEYDQNGVAWPVCTTYHNFNTYDSWYLILPDGWEGQFTLSRGDTNTAAGERSIVFSYWTGDEGTKPQPFLVIYKLTGTNRVSRSKLGNRFILQTTTDAIFAAEFISCDWNCDLDEEGLRARFSLIQTDWSTSD